MAKPKRIYGRLQFSLRSLLLVILGVALYLGFERWQAETVQRQLAAIRDLGGEVLELDSSSWSLLRFVDPATYGRRIAVAEVSSDRVQAAMPLLKSLPGLRALHVTHDIEHAVEPDWESLRRQFAPVTIVAVAEVRLGDDAAVDLLTAEVETGAFSSSDPAELQFSCAMCLDSREEACADALAEAHSARRLSAARGLWHGRSRRHASKVLKYLADPPLGVEEYRAFQVEVEASFEPQAILRELREGDYPWGAWLAFLRPHKDLVPALVAGLKDKPDMLPETMLALGNSRDPRALEPLLDLLKSKDYEPAGNAAQALGYLGRAEAEPKLIEALAADNGWLQVNACGALAKMGSRRALPALEKLANDNRYTGALNVKGMAEYAIESIKKRQRR